MIFRDYLQEILDQIDGSLAATLMAEDGIPVADCVRSGDVDIKTIAIEFSKILKDADRLCAELLAGSMEEVVVCSKEFQLLLLPVNAQYFLALLLNRQAQSGKGRFLLRHYRPKIIAQL